jgi:signal transduction histidine kinase
MLALEALETQAVPARVHYDHAHGDPLWVKADPDLLQQVLTNLFVNAIQAMPEGGTLRVRYSDAPVRKEGRAFIGVSVADTGYGIPAENLDQIFDPFFSTKEVGSGTGLGLSISSRIAEEHEGWLSADNWRNSQGEGGAVFTLYLPQAIAPAAAARHEGNGAEAEEASHLVAAD